VLRASSGQRYITHYRERRPARPRGKQAGSTQEQIHEALDYGVVKMNVDTDMQYAFTRAVAGHMFNNYDRVLKVDGELGSKKTYDPRSYLGFAEAAMAERVKQVASDLRASGQTMFGS
jgi:fructose-bisphosphate aldolase, class II